MVVVNWNSEACIDRCLTALLSQSVVPHKIILVDNASNDTSLDIVRRFPSVVLIQNQENMGFAYANNTAINGAIESQYVALLNPDAFPERNWLSELLSAVNSNPDCASFGSRQLSANAPEILDGTGDVFHVSGKVSRDGKGHLQNDSDLISREIFSPCAAAALYRRQAFLDIGGFDEDFFCYMEDVDLGFRLRLAGHKAMYVPDAVVHHIGSAATGGSRSDFSIYHGHRNLVWCFVKNMPGVLFWLLLPVHLLLNVITVLWFLLTGHGKVILRAKRDALLGLPKMWKKRKQIQAGRVASIASIWRVLDKSLVFFKR